MLRLLSTILGVIGLVAGAVMLWQARGPLPDEERTTGGILYTQAEIQAAGGTNNLDVMTDEGFPTSTTIVGEAQVSGGAASDLAQLDPDEVQAAPPPVAAAPGMTTDVQLSEDVGVEVAPLNLIPAPSGDGGGSGGPVAGSYEQRVVELEWPREFRVGRTGAVRITLKVLEGGALQPVAEVEDNEVVATPILITDRCPRLISTSSPRPRPPSRSSAARKSSGVGRSNRTTPGLPLSRLD
jgi:hypothetical protein